MGLVGRCVLADRRRYTLIEAASARRRDMKKGRIAAAFRESLALDRTLTCQGTPFWYQRWRALKRGFDLQITKTLPRRRTTLQSRWRVFADFREDRTFMTTSADEMGDGATKPRIV